MQLLRVCLLAIGIAVECNGKVWKGLARLSARRPWVPLTSFAYDIGNGELEITVENKSLAKLPDGVKVLAILDEDWPYFLEEGRCEERENLKRWEVPLVPTQRREGGQSVSYTKISQAIRPHVWYLVASHCPTKNKPSPFMRIEITAKFVQDGGSHVSYEDKLTTRVIPIMFFGFTIAAIFIGQLVLKRYREGGRLHPTLQMMVAALGMHWTFLALHTLHLWVYAANGRGFHFLDVLGEVLHWGGQLLVSFVLVGLAYGWTLSSKAVQKLIPDDKSMVYLMAGCLGFVHLMLIVLGRLNDDHYSKSHSLDSAPAYLLVLIRLVLLAVFLVGAVKTFEGEQNSTRRSFIGRLVVLGTLWFAAMPVLVLVAMVCAEYIQEPVVSIGGLLMQSLGLSVLSWLFLTRNEYYKMSSLAHTGMLPYNRSD